MIDLIAHSTERFFYADCRRVRLCDGTVLWQQRPPVETQAHAAASAKASTQGSGRDEDSLLFCSFVCACDTQPKKRGEKRRQWEQAVGVCPWEEHRGIVLGQGTAWQYAATFKEPAFCTFPESSRKRKLHEPMSVFLLLPKITDELLGLGSALEGEGAAAPHAEAASGKRAQMWLGLTGAGKCVKYNRKGRDAQSPRVLFVNQLKQIGSICLCFYRFCHI